MVFVSEYRLPAPFRGFRVNGGVFYTGPRAINPENSAFVSGYALVDVGGSFDFTLNRRKFTARFYAQNSARQKYFASTASNVLSYGVPPTLKFSLTASY